MAALKRSWMLIPIALLLLAGCLPATPRVVRIGLVAPFEGRFREIGSDVIPAVRLAVREAAMQAGPGDLTVELVAYDDSGDAAQAILQAERLSTDPLVKVVIGHWLPQTSTAAAPIYERAHIPFITVSAQHPSLEQGAATLAENWGGSSLYTSSADLDTALAALENAPDDGSALIGGPLFSLGQLLALAPGQADRLISVTDSGTPDDWETRYPEFHAGYLEGSLGAEPGIFAAQAYLATREAIRLALDEDSNGSHEMWPPENTIYVYGWQDGQRVLLCSGLPESLDCPLP